MSSNPQQTLDVASLNDVEQASYLREFLKNYNVLSQRCFVDCVNEFSSAKVGRSEGSCVSNCAEKNIKVNQRISTRFQVLLFSIYLETFSNQIDPTLERFFLIIYL